ncbi:hypothetical protein ATCC90586_003147 [Pythium insidiosum]|nr:hypothetical protein ATCC90586_003147 [Pythium insidiosum]
MAHGVRLALWLASSGSAALEPFAIALSYAIAAGCDSLQPLAVWPITATEHFNNASTRACARPDDSTDLRDCFFELPVGGPGAWGLANATCRSYFPVDRRDRQRIGAFFGNCSLANGTTLSLPSDRFATTRWSVQASSRDKRCLDRIGEGPVFPCDAYATGDGRVLNFRESRTESAKWCREFGGLFVNDLLLDMQQVLVAQTSAPPPSFISLPLETHRPVFSLIDVIGCPADMHIGGVSTRIATRALYGATTVPWTAHTTRSARSNAVSQANDSGMFRVTTQHAAEGDLMQIRSWYKDLLRLALLVTVVLFRVTSVYWPMYLAQERRPRPLATGFAVHKRERRSLVVLTLLSIETIASGEDIAMFCFQIAESKTSWVSLALRYLSITRVVWPVAWLLLLLHRVSRGRVKTALVDDLVLFLCPVVWLYLPASVTADGLELFQGSRWTGALVRHDVNSIRSRPVSHVEFYIAVFGRFTGVAAVVLLTLGMLASSHRLVKRSILRGSKAMSPRTSVAVMAPSTDTDALKMVKQKSVKAVAGMTLDDVLRQSSLGLARDEIREITRLKTRRSSAGEPLTDALSLAAEGFVALVYGPHEVLGVSHWGRPVPVRDARGRVARISGVRVELDDALTLESLVATAARPACIGVPDLL